MACYCVCIGSNWVLCVHWMQSPMEPAMHTAALVDCRFHWVDCIQCCTCSSNGSATVCALDAVYPMEPAIHYATVCALDAVYPMEPAIHYAAMWVDCIQCTHMQL